MLLDIGFFHWVICVGIGNNRWFVVTYNGNIFSDFCVVFVAE